MRRREKTVVAGGKVAFAAIEGQRGGKGIFGLEEKAEERARHAQLQCLAEEIVAYERGYESAWRRCPRCRHEQRYKGAVSRALVFDRGTLTVQRASYVCPTCRQTSYPL